MKYLFIGLAIGLLVLMALLAILSMRDDSITNDEIAHIVAGYSYLAKQDYRLNAEHPPLVKDLAALPLLFLDLNFPFSHPAWTEKVNGQWELGPAFLYLSGNDPDQIVFWARLPMVFLLVILSLFLFYWAKELGGEKNFLFPLSVLVLFVFCPNFLAHGRLVTTDVAATLGFVVSTYVLLRFLERPCWKNSLFLALAVGFALLVKFSTVILIPFFLFVWFIYLGVHGGLGNLAFIRKYVLFGGVTVVGILLLVGVVYQLHMLNYSPERQLKDSQAILGMYYGVPPETISFDIAKNSFLRPYAHYTMGLLRTFARVQMINIQHILGRTGESGWLYYFPVLYFFKIPLAFHVLTIFAALGLIYAGKIVFLGQSSLGRIREGIRKHFTEVVMACFILIYGGFAILSPMNIGFRHLLPIMPFLYVLVVSGVFAWIRKSTFLSAQKKVAMVGILVGWYVFSSVSAFPHYLSYYNEAGGGMWEGYKIAGDSNYDWGQDLGRLTQWVEDQGIDKVYVDIPFHWGDPKMFEETYILWKGSSLWRLHGVSTDDPASFPKGNYLAINATHLVSEDWTKKYSQGKDYAWLAGHTLVARPGPSIFVYYIE